MDRTEKFYFSGDNDIYGAMMKILPNQGKWPVMEARFGIAVRHILTAGAKMVTSALGWTRSSIRLDAPFEPSVFSSSGQPIGKATSRVTASEWSIALPSVGFEELTFCLECEQASVPTHPAASNFIQCVSKACEAAIAASRIALVAIRAKEPTARASEWDVSTAQEMLAAAVPERALTDFFRTILAEPLGGLKAFLLGYVPFTHALNLSLGLFRWVGELPSKTYEGDHISTGVVLVRKLADIRKISGLKVIEFAASKTLQDLQDDAQFLALANGKTSFMIINLDHAVLGIALIRSLSEKHAPSRVEFPLDSLWMEVKGPDLTRIWGAVGTAPFQIGRIRRGRFEIFSRRSSEETLARILKESVSPECHSFIENLALTLLDRAEQGDGCGIVITPEPDALPGSHGERLKAPVSIAKAAGWTTFLNPDGAVVLDISLRLHAYGKTLATSPIKILPHKGTRHNTLAHASKSKGCTSIALSDDGSLSVFRDGALVFALV